MNKIKMTDLESQYLDIQNEINPAIQSVLYSSNFILGTNVIDFEHNLARYFNIKYAISVASGTDAIVLSLLALNISKGDEVITTPFTFIATVEAICRAGATPVFCDIDYNTYNIDCNKLEEKITSKTKAIIPVHLYGLSCNMNKLMYIAKSKKLKVIEDNAQSFGARYFGQLTGTFGNCGCLSFFPGKTLGCFGDGGAVITNDSEIIERIKIFRNHGQTKKYIYAEHGINSRLDEIQAAVLNVKLNHIAKWIQKRIIIAKYYIENINNKNLILPIISTQIQHAFNYFTLRVKSKRNKLQNNLLHYNIPSAIFYPRSLHLQNVYKNFGYKNGDFPIAEQAQNEVLSIPMCPYLNTEQMKYIVKIINHFKR